MIFPEIPETWIFCEIWVFQAPGGIPQASWDRCGSYDAGNAPNGATATHFSSNLMFFMKFDVSGRDKPSIMGGAFLAGMFFSTENRHVGPKSLFSLVVVDGWSQKH